MKRFFHSTLKLFGLIIFLGGIYYYYIRVQDKAARASRVDNECSVTVYTYKDITYLIFSSSKGTTVVNYSIDSINRKRAVH